MEFSGYVYADFDIGIGIRDEHRHDLISAQPVVQPPNRLMKWSSDAHQFVGDDL